MMSLTKYTCGISLLSLVAACATEPGASAPAERGPSIEPSTAESTSSDPLRVVFGHAGDAVVYGVAEAPLAETDQRPRYTVFIEDGADATPRQLVDVALDAAVDADTGSLAWVDGARTLWVAPLDAAPANKRDVADLVLPGLATSRGRLAFATRIDGPETAPFVWDLRTGKTIPLDDGPGPDEIMGFSPDGNDVLLLSSRTGLSSLFVADVATGTIRQLTNKGLRLGPSLDTAKVVPAPMNAREVVWGPRGIAYRAHQEVVLVDEIGNVARMDVTTSLREAVR